MNIFEYLTIAAAMHMFIFKDLGLCCLNSLSVVVPLKTTPAMEHFHHLTTSGHLPSFTLANVMRPNTQS